jgi:cell division protein FtsN
MLQTGESENEILLGNKQLLAIFFVVVLLLGVAFAGGYKLGQASKKSGQVAGPVETAATSTTTQTAGQTHDVTPGDTTETSQTTATDTTSNAPAEQEPPTRQAKRTARSAPAEDTEAAGPPSSRSERTGEFSPQPGQMFLQVAAVGKDEAEAVADVLHKKGFRAHAVPKPGSPKIYRVLIGPLKDTADLSATRDSLRRTGFREVITQRY